MESKLTHAPHQVIDRFRTAFAGQDIQIVSLGGGSETTWFRLKTANEQPKLYLELDLTPVAKSKVAKIKEIHELNKLTSARDECKEDEHVLFYTNEYRVLACDLTDLELFTKLMTNHVDFTKPTLFVSECVLVYVDPEASGRLIEYVAKSFACPAFVTYEQILPHDAFGEQMMTNLKRRGCELKGIAAHPDIPSQEKRFLSRGWDRVQAVDMRTVYYNVVSKTDRLRAEKLEIFDEFEEFFLIMQHYAMTLALKGDAVAKEDVLNLSSAV